MSTENLDPFSAPDEKQLCLSCLVPNEPSAHFCAKCGAPLSSYAATAPFESIFAEGHVYRQAVQRPRKLIVVLGVWLLFGGWVIGAGTFVLMGLEDFGVGTVIAVFLIVISLVMIWKSTRNYLRRDRDQTVSLGHEG